MNRTAPRRVPLPSGSGPGLLLAALLAASCGDDGPGANQNPCPEGHQVDGPACVPIFDDPDACGAPNEMPVLGGGCRAVGVTQCATGFVGDGEGGCEPILPSAPCPPGTMETIGQTECQPVGVTQCATGFVGDGEGGCDPILPVEMCPSGTLEVIGFDTCQPLGDCGPEGSPWGLIAVDAATVYVDASADATGASGSASAPFPTITAALAAVEPGGQVALAAGVYAEAVTLDEPVRLEGRCSALVTLQGSLSVAPGGAGSEVRGVTVTGPGEGLQVTGAQPVVIEAVEVRDTGSYGVALRDRAGVTLRRVKVSGAATAGILSEDSTLGAAQTVVQGTVPEPGTDLLGRGIRARCFHPDRCGSVQVESSLLTGNRDVGLSAFGVDATIRASVVRDTLPQQSDQSSGTAILASCSADVGRCGSLLLHDSLVAGNRYLGLLTAGVDVTVRSSVVRDTRPDASDLKFGWGIQAVCEATTGSCGTLRVEGSRVTGNREVGIFSLGVPTVIQDSVVSGTLPQERDRVNGQGIYALCDSVSCGPLVVEGSLVAGNHERGIAAFGVATTVRGSVVRDTLPQESDLTLGRGIHAECDAGRCGSLVVESSLVSANREMGVCGVGGDVTVRASVVQGTLPQESDLTRGLGIVAACLAGTCGTLAVEESLVAGNRDHGVWALGPEASIRASVVRDTLPQASDQSLGWGVEATCFEGGCGPLTVEESLVAANRVVGVFGEGVDVTVRSSIVRGTLPQERDRTAGRGISAQCDPDVGVCGHLTVEESLVTANREMGVFGLGVDATIGGSVVSDTLPQESDREFGRGIAIQCHPDLGVCGSALVLSSLVSGNREVGIFRLGAKAEIFSSVVRETLPRESEQDFGRGIVAQCDVGLGVCSSLSVVDSLVTRSQDLGIYISGGGALLNRVAVVESGVNPTGQRVGGSGVGILATCDNEVMNCTGLEMVSCRVAASHGAGVVIFGALGSMSESVVDTVLADPLEGLYGYGIQISGNTAHLEFDVLGSVIRDAKLAGVLYCFESQGMLSRTVVSGSEYCVAKNEGAGPTVGDDNQLSCSEQSDPAWVSLYPLPAPPPTLPVPPPGE